jgi:hypothetical protein
MVKNPNRNPLFGGKYVRAPGIEPSSGNRRIESAPHIRWNSVPGANVDVTGATIWSSTTIALPAAS